MADFLFAVFAIVFIATRNVLFSVYVVYPIPKHVQRVDGSYLELAMFKNALWILVCLHIYWASLVLRFDVDFANGMEGNRQRWCRR